jgi:hypothetical protein
VARQASNAKVHLGMDSKSGLAHYIETAGALCSSMARRGFVSIPQWCIPVDPNGELLGGAHRVACALALGIDEVVVRNEEHTAWAPPWGEQWFIDNGMEEFDLERLRQDWASIQSGMVTT